MCERKWREWWPMDRKLASTAWSSVEPVELEIGTQSGFYWISAPWSSDWLMELIVGTHRSTESTGESQHQHWWISISQNYAQHPCVRMSEVHMAPGWSEGAFPFLLNGKCPFYHPGWFGSTRNSSDKRGIISPIGNGQKTPLYVHVSHKSESLLSSMCNINFTHPLWRYRAYER